MKVGSVRIVNPALRISIVAFTIKNIDPVFGCVADDDDLLTEEGEDDDDVIVVGSIISFVVLNMMVSTQLISL
jgi:hypothetical protein